MRGKSAFDSFAIIKAKGRLDPKISSKMTSIMITGHRYSRRGAAPTLKTVGTAPRREKVTLVFSRKLARYATLAIFTTNTIA